MAIRAFQVLNAKTVMNLIFSSTSWALCWQLSASFFFYCGANYLSRGKLSIALKCPGVQELKGETRCAFD